MKCPPRLPLAVRVRFALLAAAGMLLAGCFQPSNPTDAPATAGTGSGTTGDEATRDPDAPTGSDVGKRPVQDVEANVTGEVAGVVMAINNSMTRDAYVFVGFRPRSLIPETPCNLQNLHVPALSKVEVTCRINLLSDGLLVMGVEWFDRANATIAMAVARHPSEAGDGRDYAYWIQILPLGAMEVNRTR